MTAMAGLAATGTALTGRGTGTGTESGSIAAPAVTETTVTSGDAVKAQSQAGDLVFPPTGFIGTVNRDKAFLSMHYLSCQIAANC